MVSLVKNVTHSATTLSIIITTSLDSAPDDEAWGIREFYILVDYVNHSNAAFKIV